jgi:predicted amino acid-binding ACT domain protein
MVVLRLCLPILLLALLPCAASAVVVAGANGGGNTTNNTTSAQMTAQLGLTNTAFYDNVLPYSDAGSVYLGWASTSSGPRAYLLSAMHITLSNTMLINAVSYSVTRQSISGSDLALLTFANVDGIMPPLPVVALTSSTPSIGTSVIMAGFGRNREIAVCSGFQGVHAGSNRIVTLGRGGSDTSAVAIAAGLKADRCDIYTDVDGVYTTDPRIVPEARRLSTISFEEMLELASQGSKVLQIRSVEFAGKYRVPTRVLSSFTPWDIPLDEEAVSGTLITFEEDEKMEQAVVAGIAFNRDEAKISIIGVPDKPGIAYQLLGPVADANIDVDVIIQNVSHDGRTDFSFTVHRNDYARALDLLKTKVLPAVGAADVRGDAKICKVSIVGIGMKSHVGVAATMFRTLSEEGINIQMITTSEIKTSVVIDEKYMELAVRALHKAFGLEQPAA